MSRAALRAELAKLSALAQRRSASVARDLRRMTTPELRGLLATVLRLSAAEPAELGASGELRAALLAEVRRRRLLTDDLSVAIGRPTPSEVAPAAEEERRQIETNCTPERN